MSLAVEAVYEVLDERTRDLLELRERNAVVHRRGWLVRRALLLADLFGLTLAFALAHAIYTHYAGNNGALNGFGEVVFFAASLPLWVVAAKVYGLYDKDEERTDHSTTDDFAGVFHLVTVCTFLLYAISRQTRWFSPEFNKLLLFWALACVTVTSSRAFARACCRRQIGYLQNTIIIGAGEVGQNIARKLLKHPEYGINLVGFVDSEPMERIRELEHLTILGDGEDLPELIELLDVERVIYAFSREPHEQSLERIRELNALGVQVDIIPRLFEGLGPSIGLHTLEGLPLVSLPPARLPHSSMFVKRALDLIASVLMLVVLGPLVLLVAVVIKIDSPGAVLYRHERVGRNGRRFGLYKFRTMKREFCRGTAYGGALAEEAFERLMEDDETRKEFATSFKLQRDPRVTRVGRLLRRTSIDELPQLLNVVAGSLSLVGPRPLTAEEIDLYYGTSASDLLSIRPGVTGYWQTNGRSNLEYIDRVRLDLAYMRGWSLALDLTILARTARVIFGRRGAV